MKIGFQGRFYPESFSIKVTYLPLSKRYVRVWLHIPLPLDFALVCERCRRSGPTLTRLEHQIRSIPGSNELRSFGCRSENDGASESAEMPRCENSEASLFAEVLDLKIRLALSFAHRFLRAVADSAEKSTDERTRRILTSDLKIC